MTDWEKDTDKKLRIIGLGGPITNELPPEVSRTFQNSTISWDTKQSELGPVGLFGIQTVTHAKVFGY